MKQTIYLIRHGHTEGTTQGIMYGRTELRLTEAGRQEVEALRGKDVYPKPDGARIYTSGMIRTEETLEAIYGKVEHEQAPKLKEINMGIFEMKPLEEVLAQDWGRDWLEGKHPDLAAPEGESQNQFVSRVQEGFREVVDDNRDGTFDKIIIVCHGGVIAFVMDGLFPGQKAIGWEWTPKPGFGYEVTLEDGEAKSYKQIL